MCTHNDLLYSALACSYTKSTVAFICVCMYAGTVCMYFCIYIYMSMCVQYSTVCWYVCMFFAKFDSHNKSNTHTHILFWRCQWKTVTDQLWITRSHAEEEFPEFLLDWGDDGSLSSHKSFPSFLFALMTSCSSVWVDARLPLSHTQTQSSL